MGFSCPFFISVTILPTLWEQKSPGCVSELLPLTNLLNEFPVAKSSCWDRRARLQMMQVKLSSCATELCLSRWWAAGWQSPNSCAKVAWKVPSFVVRKWALLSPQNLEPVRDSTQAKQQRGDLRHLIKISSCSQSCCLPSLIHLCQWIFGTVSGLLHYSLSFFTVWC